jgi:hypothetical protein
MLLEQTIELANSLVRYGCNLKAIDLNLRFN